MGVGRTNWQKYQLHLFPFPLRFCETTDQLVNLRGHANSSTLPHVVSRQINLAHQLTIPERVLA